MSPKPPPSPAAPSDAVDHGPLPTARVPPGSYEPGFLRGLEARREVLPVGENWNRDESGLPPRVKWVLYPNGDLERIRF